MRLMVHSKYNVARPFEVPALWHSSGLFGEGMVCSMLEQEAGDVVIVVVVKCLMEWHPPELCRWGAQTGGR